MKKCVFFGFLFLTLAFSKAVSAQISTPVQSSLDFIGRQNTYDSWKMNNMMFSSAARPTGRSGKSVRSRGGSSSNNTATGGGRRTNNATVVAAVRGATTFSSTGSFLMPKYIAEHLGKNEKEKREFEETFVKGLNSFRELEKIKGYVKNDVARAASSVFVFCISSHSGKPLTQKQKDGVYKTFKEFYETDKTFQSLGNQDKQRIYEKNAIFWSFVYIADVAAAMKGDVVSRKKAKETAAFVFQSFTGVSIDKVRLSADGLTSIKSHSTNLDRKNKKG